MIARWALALLLLAAPLLLLLGCQSSPAPPNGGEPEPAWFVDVTEEVGLNFVHDCGATGTYFMPQLTGGGAAFLDYDNDGRLDLVLVQGGGPGSRSTNRLFHQRPNGHFEDVSAGSGLDVVGHGQGAAVGDVNNDGWSDILVTEFGAVRLFLNQRNGKFVERTKQAGLDNPQWGTSAAFVDYDRDGRLDLLVVNYVEYSGDKVCSAAGGQKDFCGPKAFAGVASRLFRNLGPSEGPEAERISVRFQDVTTTSGLAAHPGPGLGVVCPDFDGDGWPDILIANDGAPNHLWINQKNGTFKEEAVLRRIAYNGMGQAEANMGVALGDVDGDGLFDLYVTHLHSELHRLWKQSPRGSFRDQTAAAGLASSSSRSTGFGTLLADFNNDGAVDLVVANGRVKRDENQLPASSQEQFWAPYREPNHLYVNDGQGRFQNRSAHEPGLCGVPGVWRGVAYGDVSNTGALDLLVTRLDGSVRLYRNVAPNRGKWLTVRVRDPALQRDAYGAEVSVTAGSRRWTRWINPETSYACSNDPRAHFGLGSVDCVDEIRVLWPDGRQERFPGQATNQAITLRKGQGEPLRPNGTPP